MELLRDGTGEFDEANQENGEPVGWPRLAFLSILSQQGRTARCRVVIEAPSPGLYSCLLE